jgi:hypothetical protein
VASLGSTTTTAPASGGANASTGPGGKGNPDQAVKFSQCMRSHGVPSFPDPTISGNRATIQISGNSSNVSGLDPKSPKFQAAQSACQHLLPKGGQISPQQQAQAQDDAVRFAQCMRAHGINIPDPQMSGNGGGIQMKITPGQGVDPNAPQFQAAQSACQHFLPFNGKGGSVSRTGGPSAGATGGSQ